MYLCLRVKRPSKKIFIRTRVSTKWEKNKTNGFSISPCRLQKSQTFTGLIMQKLTHVKCSPRTIFYQIHSLNCQHSTYYKVLNWNVKVIINRSIIHSTTHGVTFLWNQRMLVMESVTDSPIVNQVGTYLLQFSNRIHELITDLLPLSIWDTNLFLTTDVCLLYRLSLVIQKRQSLNWQLGSTQLSK